MSRAAASISRSWWTETCRSEGSRSTALDIGSRWSMIALSAEPSSAYAELLDLGPAWPVSCTGDVYGYLPTEAQRRAGGYEADGYFAALGLQARLRPDGERRVVEACRTTFGKRP